MTALAMMIALVGAMFVAFPSAHAAQGDVSEASGFCVQSNGTDGQPNTADDTYTVQTELTGGDNVTVESGLEEDAETPELEAKPTVQCDSDQAGLPVTVTPDGSVTPIVEVKAASVAITINDSDGVIKGGQDIMATVTVKNFRDPQPTIDWIRVSGVLDGPDNANPLNDSDGSACGAAFDTCTSVGNSIIVPVGTSEGEYTISARIAYDDFDASNGVGDVHTTATKTFTVGDTGTNVASASLELGTAEYDNPKTVKDEAQTEDGAEPSTGDIWLKVSVANSLGKASNAGGVHGITVFATGGATLQVLPANALGRPDETAANNGADVNMATGPNSATLNEDPDDDDEVGSTMFVKVTKTNKKPGTVNVWAIVTGSDGSGTTETLDLIFTGSASTLTLGDAGNVAPDGVTEFTISASDDGGNPTAPGRVRYSVTDADGKAVGSSIIAVTTGKKGDSTPTYKLDDNSKVEAGIVTVGETAAPGQYTVTTMIVGASDSAADATITVVGHPANIALEADATEVSEIGGVVTVTATVTDEDDNTVANNTPVLFEVSKDTGLAAIGTGHGDGDNTPTTRNGTVSVKYAVVGAGTSVVSATNSTTGVTGVVVVTSTAGASDSAMPEEEASLSCLSSLSGFSTWTCDVEASASEIFDWISSRGATALHLNSNRMWVRYSVVDGAMVPGSSDFMVTKSDILYISN